MSEPASTSFRAPSSAYQREADALHALLAAGDEAAAWRYRWGHPRFRGLAVDQVRADDLEPCDAQLVVAREHAFADWASLATFAEAVAADGPVSRFEAAVEAVVDGDLAALRAIIHAHPPIVRERSARRHRATLLHYVAANGVEDARQRTPPNAVEVATLLLDAGAEPDALADMYEHQCTTMSMLVSSAHPHGAGLQVPLAMLLLDRGATSDGPGSAWQSAVATALVFGYPDTAAALAARGAPVTDLAIAAGLGRVDDVTRLLPAADAPTRHAALAIAAQHGHVRVVQLLLDAGERVDRYNPDGFHSHATPLHHAVWAGHERMVRLLVERGARLDIADTLYRSTPLGWALYGERASIADYLRERGAPA